METQQLIPAASTGSGLCAKRQFTLVAAIAVRSILPGCAERPSPVWKTTLGGDEVRKESALPRPHVSLPAVVYLADFGLGS
jgi:hypothetical protein